MNNHMGSKATQDKRVMEIILKIAKQRDLIFIDSRTSQNSVVKEVANKLEIIAFTRDMFLDNSKTQNDIEKQLRKLGAAALKNGYAIGIGHVGAEGGIVTAEAIKAIYPKLIKDGIKFIFISQLSNVME